MLQPTKLVSVLLITSAISLLSACSNSSGGGGPAAAKPNLTPVSKVGQSISIITKAGKGENSSPDVGLAARSFRAAVSESSSPSDPSVRTKTLQNMMNQPGACETSFKEDQKSRGPSNPGQPVTMGFKLSIKGDKCPLNAEFKMISAMNPTGESKIEVGYDFKALTSEAGKTIGATDANVAGLVKFGVDAKNDIYAQGDIAGHVSSLEYGRVEFSYKLRGQAQQDANGGAKGVMNEEATFKAPEAKIDITLLKVSTMNGEKQSTSYSANGAAITSEEYKEIMKAWGVDNEAPDQEQNPAGPSSGDATMFPPGHPRNPGNPGKPGENPPFPGQPGELPDSEIGGASFDQ